MFFFFYPLQKKKHKLNFHMIISSSFLQNFHVNPKIRFCFLPTLYTFFLLWTTYEIYMIVLNQNYHRCRPYLNISVLGWVIPKTKKTVLDTSLLNTQHYKVRIKGKVGQSWKRSSAPLHFCVVAIEKGAFWSPSTKIANYTTYFTLYQ